MKKVLIALNLNPPVKKLTEGDIAESILKTAKNLHGNRIVKGSQNRKWLEKYCHGKCYARSFASSFTTGFRHSNQTKKMNIVVVLKQGYSAVI